MSRWERVNCASLAAILIALLLLAGHSLPIASATAAPATSAPATTQPAATELVESDQEPSGIRSLTIAELHTDAANTLASLPIEEPSGQYTAISEYVASYDVAAPTFPSTHFTIESINYPGVFHVFHMVATQRA